MEVEIDEDAVFALTSVLDLAQTHNVQPHLSVHANPPPPPSSQFGFFFANFDNLLNFHPAKIPKSHFRQKKFAL